MPVMRASVLALIVGAGLAVPLRADLRIKVKETFASGIASRAEYYKGNRWRRESEQSGGHWILDLTNKSAITLDPAKREKSLKHFTPPHTTPPPSPTNFIH